MAGVEPSGCAGAAELDGDYILDLVDRHPDRCRWEVSFPSKCRFYRMGLVATPDDWGGVDARATLEGAQPGPAWIAQGLRDLGGFAQLRFDRATSWNPSAGCLWPETVALSAIPSTAPAPTPVAPGTIPKATGRHYISPEPTPRQVAEMEALSGASSGSCQLTGITPTSATTCINKILNFTAKGMNLGAVRWSTTPAGNPATGTGDSFTTQWSMPGNVTIKASCGGVTKTVNATIVMLTFAQSSIKVGKRLPKYDKNISVTTTLDCVPPNQVGNVSLAVTGTNRIKITNITRNIATGVLTFTVTGTVSTPVGFPGGDTTIEAHVGLSPTCAKMQVIVIIPASIGLPHQEENGVVAPQNIVVNGKTRPPYKDVPVGLYLMITAWFFPLTVTVWDQFNDALNGLYAGAPISEYSTTYNIGVSLSGSGTYVDLVGVDQQDGFVPTSDDKTITDWKKGKPLAMLPRPDDNQNIRVYVGGQPIGTIKRTVIAIPPSSVQIIWP